MKHTTLTMAIISSAAIGLASFELMSDNGKAGYAGSPGKLLCNDCHDTYGASNSGTGTISISSNMTGNQYVPGATYNISVKVKQTGRSLFGVGCEVLSTSNANAGTIVVTDASHTTTKNATINGTSRKSLVHKLNGGSSSDSATFNFNWTAPASNIGNVKFYFAGIASNGNGSENGDYAYHNSLTVTPGSATGITNQEASQGIHIWPSLNGNQVQILTPPSLSGPCDISVFNLSGQYIFRQQLHLNGSVQTTTIDLPAGTEPGVYFINVSGSSLSQSRKIFLGQ